MEDKVEETLWYKIDYNKEKELDKFTLDTGTIGICLRKEGNTCSRSFL